MRACYCAIPAMGGSCCGCPNYEQPPQWNPNWSAPVFPQFPQVGGEPTTAKPSNVERKLDEIIELLRSRRLGE